MNVQGNDGTNIVSFDEGSPLGAGTLGVCFSYFSGCPTGGTIRWFIAGQDILFNRTFNWNYGTNSPSTGQFDFESVALHELGHAHLHGHVINPSAVMHFAFGPTQTGRVLSINDLDGADFALNLSSTGVCGQSAFIPLSVGSCNVLPIDLVSIEALCSDGTPLLRWKTASEFNNQFFIVEYSSDAVNWLSADTISGAGFSSELLQYEWSPAQLGIPLPVYLRIKQQDFDGSYSFSPTVELVSCGNSKGDWTVFPNPAADRFFLAVDSPEDQIFLYDMSGRLLKIFDIETAIGTQEINTNFLQNGMYLLARTSAPGNVKKLTIQR